MVERIPGFCALCRSRCGSISVVDNGVLVAQEAYPEHPTGAALCVKGRAAPEIVANPQRLLHPLIRTRPKTDDDPGWRRASWDEALALVADRLGALRAAHGAESVAFSMTSPSGAPVSDGINWIYRFVNAFGSPNSVRGTEICNWVKDVAHAYTFGRGIASPDFDSTRCVMLWGHNPSATWLDHATGVTEAMQRGAKLVVVDPRRAGFAARADQWLRVKPGTDGALALGIAGEMIRTGAFDRRFVQQHSNGPLLVRPDSGRLVREGDLAGGSPSSRLVAWDAERGEPAFYDPATREYDRDVSNLALAGTFEVDIAQAGRLRCATAFQSYADLCAEYPPERVESLCWVPADQVRDTAQVLFANRPVSYYAWSGLSQHSNATQTDRALALLYALTGSFDAKGGNVDFAHVPVHKTAGGELMPPEQLRKCVAAGDQPLGPARQGSISTEHLYRAVIEKLPYAIRGLVGFGGNLALSHANPRRAKQALEQLEFFVQLDVTLTPSARYADVVLPINTPWEREALRVGFEINQQAEELVQLRRAMVPSAGESRSDAQVVFDLAVRLGMGDCFWDGDIDAGNRHLLEPSGITLEALRERPEGIRVPLQTQYRRYRDAGFATPTGKVEIYSEQFAEKGQPPLPRFVESLARLRADPEVERRYPLVLTSSKVVQYCHSQHRQVPALRKRMPEPLATMHPDTAAARGIKKGDWVRLATPEGEIRMKAAFDAQLHPSVVCAQYGWWQANEGLGEPAYDPLSPQGANYNLLIGDAESDPINGAPSHRSYPCEVSSAA